jgi:hypothetical protein
MHLLRFCPKEKKVIESPEIFSMNGVIYSMNGNVTVLK